MRCVTIGLCFIFILRFFFFIFSNRQLVWSVATTRSRLDSTICRNIPRADFPRRHNSHSPQHHRPMFRHTWVLHIILYLNTSTTRVYLKYYNILKKNLCRWPEKVVLLGRRIDCNSGGVCVGSRKRIYDCLARRR